MKKAILSLGSMLLVSAVPAFAQGLGLTYDVSYACRMTTETDTKQTLSDGTHITSKAITRFYRDSLGRTRTEIFPDQFQPGAAKDQPVQVIISDPVESVQYFLYPHDLTATRNTMEPPPANPPLPMAVDAGAPLASPDLEPSIPATEIEDLGMQLVQGVWATGSRVTTTYAVGSIGNDQPIVTVSENWYSEQVGTVVFMKQSDPRMGETTQSVTIDLTVPDPALFRPPANYRIIRSDQSNR
jgi:hypothetical protein